LIARVLDWLGFGSHGHHDEGHHGHGLDRGYAHIHGVVDPTVATTALGIWAIKWSFLILAATAALQLVVVFVSDSVALLADTIHNIGDAGTAIPLWIAFLLARKKPTQTFTYGYGRVEDFAGLAVVLIILSSALVAGYQAITRLIHPIPVLHLGWLAAAGVIGFLGNEAVAVFRIRIGREINSAALIADGYHARTDGLTSLAVVVGAFGVWMGFPLADPIVGLIITVVILGIVWQSGKAVLARMLDGVEPQLITELQHAAQHVKGVLRVEAVRARWLGHRLHAEMTLAVDPALLLTDVRKLTEEIRSHAQDHLAALQSLHVEVVPASRRERPEHHPEAEDQHHH
jgi:cation diffusion facilitator family transporter